ncbi:slit homolog 3 protein [Hypomesus transpacificus]|uniref:slit homolog 3 protein n=1 Tax=Hypomesus transpacificus TaxID=137520 RepID=UPI001F07E1CE|nr:slit homolog 3 protein [Hypomesus transpacificus]
MAKLTKLQVTLNSAGKKMCFVPRSVGTGCVPGQRWYYWVFVKRGQIHFGEQSVKSFHLLFLDIVQTYCHTFPSISLCVYIHVCARVCVCVYNSVESVNDGLFHTVELLIQNHSLSLVVDNGAPKSLGKLLRQPSMDHNTQLYIGGVPSQVVASVLRPSPERNPPLFNGCIHNVRINSDLQDLGGVAGPRGAQGALPGCHSCSVCAQGACRQEGETGVTCECPPGRTGVLCDQRTAPSPCQTSRCVHGLCVPKDSSYSCQCAEGYSGLYCDKREEPPGCRGHHCGHGECRMAEGGEPVCFCQPGYTGPTCDTELTCQGEAVREVLKRHHPMKTCTSTTKVPRVECPRSCLEGLCCGPSKSRRRKVSFRCTDGSTYSEEMETTLECSCAKCPL